jgi:hypothetical protein
VRLHENILCRQGASRAGSARNLGHDLRPGFRLELREALGVRLAAVVGQVLEASKGKDEGDHAVLGSGVGVLRKEAHTWSGAGS